MGGISVGVGTVVVFGMFFITGVQFCWPKSVTAEGLDLDAMLGPALLSVWLQLHRTR